MVQPETRNRLLFQGFHLLLWIHSMLKPYPHHPHITGDTKLLACWMKIPSWLFIMRIFSQECSHIFMVASASPLLFASWQFPRVFGMYSSHSPICWQHTVSAAWFSLQFLGCRISQTENFDGETNHKPPDFFWPLFWDNPICQVAQSTTNIYKSCNPPTEKTHHILHLWISPLYPAISIFHLYSIDIP